MSHSSDSDEFFDAEEITPSKINSKLNVENETKSGEIRHGVLENKGKDVFNTAWTSQETKNVPVDMSHTAFTLQEIKDVPVDISNTATTSQETKDVTVDISNTASTSQETKDVAVDISNTASTLQETKNDVVAQDSVDVNMEKNFGQGRRKFRELRQFMQTEEDDGGHSPTGSQTSSIEGVFPSTSKTAHPFRIIEHDKISLQSMTSLGRIGRILNGSIDPSGLSIGKESQISGGLSSTTSDGASEINRIPNVEESSGNHGMQMQEPDVIASTKSNSLKHSQVPTYDQVADSGAAGNSTNMEPQSLPVAPPRKRKKVRNDETRSLPPPDPVQIVPQAPAIPRTEKPERPTLKALNVKPPTLSEILDNSTMVELSSPASTIESLTREFQNSLDMTIAENAENAFTASKESFVELNIFGGRHGSPPNKSEASSRSSTITSNHSDNSGSFGKGNYSLDIKSALKGRYVVKPQDEERAKASGPSKAELERLENLRNAFNTHVADSKNNSNVTGLGHSSLGSSNRSSTTVSEKSSKERRKSAGDENGLKQLNMYVRTRTDSGKELTDMEILEQVTVLNLDTGERVPLSVAEDKLPQCINPLSLHIMRLTSEYISNSSSLYDNNKHRESDDESIISRAGSSIGNKDGISGAGSMADGMDENAPGGLKKRTARLKRFLGSTVKKTMNKAKSIAAEVSHARHKEDVADIVDEVRGEQNIKLKASNSHKGPYNFDGCVRHVQEFSEHVGPVWCMKFSQCGRLLATAGQDKVLRIWVIKDAYSFFQDMRTKYNANQKSSPTPSQESLVSHQSIQSEDPSHSASQPDSPSAPFMPKPFCVYTGHTSDLLDVSWSKNYFVLSSSMDKTVRLWHISRKECLCCFQHIDFVTAIVFHPRDDRYFLSGSLDGKLRLWNIPDKKVAVWNEIDGQTKLITAANFCQNGKFAVVGSYDGRCIFYTTDQLKYHTQIDVRSTRGKNSTGRKISGIEPMPGEDKILVTSNDSRIRLYDLRDLSLSCKYKGYVNVSSQIKASFSHDGKFIVSGSENQCIYIWKTHHDYSKFTSVRRDRNDFWEGIKAHNAVVTCAVFAPNPENIIRMIDEREQISKGTGPLELDPEKVEDPMVEQRTKGCGGHVLVSADFNGCIKVFVNKTKPKHSSLPVSALA